MLARAEALPHTQVNLHIPHCSLRPFDPTPYITAYSHLFIFLQDNMADAPVKKEEEQSPKLADIPVKEAAPVPTTEVKNEEDKSDIPRTDIKMEVASDPDEDDLSDLDG